VDRVDKFMDYSIASLMAPERADEFKSLLELSHMLFFLPFEINKKIALNLQISEQFVVHFMDKGHPFIKTRAESTFGPMDTGIKLVILFVLWSEDGRG
jgi:hypothetical protein